MNASRKKIVAGGIAALAVAGGGAAIAATQLGTPSERSAAVVTDAANQLGVQPSALSDALKSAEKKQIDAAVAAGEITKEQGDAAKAAIDSGRAPLVNVGPGGFERHGFGPGGPGGPHGGFAGGLDAAATYLGVTEAQLRTELQNGKTLADVAKATQGKSVDGLVAAMVDAATTKLDAAVKAGTITQSQADTMKADLESHVTDMVNGTFPARPDFDHDGGPAGGGYGFRHFGPNRLGPAQAGGTGTFGSVA
jgi:hypothetical protein